VKKSDLVKYHEEIGFSNPRKEKALLERMEKLRNLT